MKRNIEIKLRLSKYELQILDNKVKKTGMSRESYMRTVLKGYAPIESPPVEYYDVLRELRAIGNNMHQIAYKANTLNFLDAPMYKQKADMVTKMCDELMAVCIPRKIK
jgi:hypothetical protein